MCVSARSNAWHANMHRKFLIRFIKTRSHLIRVVRIVQIDASSRVSQHAMNCQHECVVTRTNENKNAAEAIVVLHISRALSFHSIHSSSFSFYFVLLCILLYSGSLFSFPAFSPRCAGSLLRRCIVIPSIFSPLTWSSQLASLEARTECRRTNKRGLKTQKTALTCWRWRSRNALDKVDCAEWREPEM